MFLKCSYSSSLKDGHYKISGYDDGNDDSNEVNNKKEKHYPDTKTRKRHYKKASYSPMSLMNTDTKIILQVLVNQIQ